MLFILVCKLKRVTIEKCISSLRVLLKHNSIRNLNMESVGDNRKQVAVQLWKYLGIISIFLLTILQKLTELLQGTFSASKKRETGNGVRQAVNLKRFEDIPGPRALPFFGTLLTDSFLSCTDLVKANEEQMSKYGPLIRQEHYWNYPLTIALDPHDIETVIKSSSFIRPGIEMMIAYRTLRKDRYTSFGLVNAQGEEWIRLHKVLTPGLLSPKSVSKNLPAVDEICSDFVSQLREKSKGGPVKFEDICSKLVAECALHMLFGKRMKVISHITDKTEKDKLTQNVEKLIDVHNDYWSAIHASLYGYPWWRYFPTKIWRGFVKAEDLMYETVEEIIDDIVGNGQVGGLLETFIDSDEISDMDKVMSVLDILLASAEPVLHTIIFAFYYLSRDDKIQEKIHEELCSVLPTKDSLIDQDTLANLPYLKACIKETFRCSPAAPNLARIIEQDMELQGHHIPAYSFVHCQTWFANLQESRFYKAKEFLPERWIPLDDSNKSRYEPHFPSLVTPFGFGKRICPGRRMAEQTLIVVLAKVFRNFHVKFSSELKVKYSWLLTPCSPINVEFKEYFD